MVSVARRLATLFAMVLALAGCASIQPPSGSAPRILIFSHFTGYRHASLPTGVAAIKALAAREGMSAIASEDVELFSEQGLAGFDAIVLLSTGTGREPDAEFFTGMRGEALQHFVRSGGGIVAIHAAGASHYNWPWYQQMIGGRFERHPKGTSKGRLTNIDPGHPATHALPATFEREDEWYYFVDYDPRVRVLLTVDPASIGEPDANPNPISWVHQFDGGRVFYTALGHTSEAYGDPLFLAHIAGGLRWAIEREQR